MASKIVVGYDFSEPGEIALTEALQQAARQPGSILHVLMSLEDKHASFFPDIAIDYQGAAEVQERVSAVVQSRVGELRPEGLAFFVHVRIGEPAEELLALAAEADADLVCLGTHGREGVKRLILGSVAEKVVRQARCPVLVARPKEYGLTTVAALEPPCPDCVQRRTQTDGKEWWCEPHAKPYVPPHRYRYEQTISIRKTDGQPIS